MRNLTGFYMMGTLVVKGLNDAIYFYTYTNSKIQENFNKTVFWQFGNFFEKSKTVEPL